MLPGKELVAVALSGPSGGLLPAKIPFALLKKDFKEKYPAFAQSEALDVQDVPLDITVSRALGIMIGAWHCDLWDGMRLASRSSQSESFLPQRIVWQMRTMPHRIAEDNANGYRYSRRPSARQRRAGNETNRQRACRHHGGYEHLWIGASGSPADAFAVSLLSGACRTGLSVRSSSLEIGLASKSFKGHEYGDRRLQARC